MENAEAAPSPRVNILGVGLAATNISHTLQRFDALIAKQSRAYVCVADVHVVMQAHWNPAFRKVLNDAEMTTTDGMPLVWLCRKARGGFVARVYGPDLLLAACEAGLDQQRRHYFYGGAEGVAEDLAHRLKVRFPGLLVVGCFSPPYRQLEPYEDAEFAAMINQADPDYVWVGLGAPKQEFWMQHMRSKLNAPILVGVGAAFDFHSGAKPQAPRWLRAAGFEWLFRLVSEPARLWPRYRKVIPSFLYQLTLQGMGVVKYSLD